jgi:hypothetical protein
MNSNVFEDSLCHVLTRTFGQMVVGRIFIGRIHHIGRKLVNQFAPLLFLLTYALLTRNCGFQIDGLESDQNLAFQKKIIFKIRKRSEFKIHRLFICDLSKESPETLPVHLLCILSFCQVAKVQKLL